MTNIEILTAFETEINQLNNELTKPSTDDSLFWLNQSVNKFIKIRFNGDFIHREGYEQTEKRRNDLIKLFKTVTYDDEDMIRDTSFASYDQYSIQYPKDFLYALNEDVVIADVDGNHKMDTCVFECTQDSFMYRINNSLTDFHYRFHRARPIRTSTKKG